MDKPVEASHLKSPAVFLKLYNQMKIEAVIDRIENDIVILLVEKVSKPILLPLKILPKGCKEKDVLTISLEIEEKKTEKSSQKTSNLIRKLSRENL